MEYEQLVQYPQVGQMLADHVQIHLFSLQEIAFNQMQQQAMVQPEVVA